MRMLAGYEEILMEKKRSLSCQNSVLDFIKSSSGTRASPPVLLDMEGDDPHDLSTLQQEVPPTYILTFLVFYYSFVHFLLIFFLGPSRSSETTFPIIVLRLWESVSRLTSSRLNLPISQRSTT
jgi:hypothetical protein